MLEIAKKAAIEAGKILMSHYGNVSETCKNSNYDAASILTKADTESEKKIIEIISKNFPDHNIHAEESGDNHNGSEYTWAIDPLDGTSNFSRNIPLFGISIGLLKNDKVVLGVLYFPVLNLLVSAEKGKGTFANDKKIRVSDRNIEQSLYYAGGLFRGSSQTEEAMVGKVGLVKTIDASSYEFAQIAMGDAELYVLANVLHDVAAGVIIISEAGGKVTDYLGADWTPDSEGIVASNGKIHDEVIKLLDK